MRVRCFRCEVSLGYSFVFCGSGCSLRLWSRRGSRRFYLLLSVFRGLMAFVAYALPLRLILRLLGRSERCFPCLESLGVLVSLGTCSCWVVIQVGVCAQWGRRRMVAWSVGGLAS